MKVSLSLIHACAVLAAATPTIKTGPTAVISGGPVIGTTTQVSNSSATVNQFLGIPYARPPIGALRFSPPLPPLSRNGKAINATSWPHACIQQGSATLLTSQSEDCLYLNVFAPSTPAGRGGRTVMVWIHGGALKTGSASIAEYDASAMAAAQDIVIVSINYRLSLLGFSNSPAVAPADRNGGFYDQRMALRWVQDNIASFGGDPKRVTIFGESSGSTSVSRLVGSMPANPPFRAAILESGWYDYASIMDISTDVPGLKAWQAIVPRLNCSSPTNNTKEELECMRSVDAASIESVLANSGSLTFTATNDNITQMEFPELARKQGHIAKVPILTGTNADEGSLFMDPTIESVEALAESFPTAKSIQKELVEAYPVGGSGFATQYEANVAIDTDSEFTCPASRIAALTTKLELPVWRYYFNATFPNTARPGYGVYHSSEISLIFGTFEASNATADQLQLSKVMQGSWANFAKDPWGSGPGWPKVTPDSSGAYAVAALGSPNRNATGWAVIGNGTVDDRCWVYQSIYADAAGGTPWW